MGTRLDAHFNGVTSLHATKACALTLIKYGITGIIRSVRRHKYDLLRELMTRKRVSES